MKEYVKRESICEKCENKNSCFPYPEMRAKCPVYKATAADVAPIVHGEWVEEKWTQTDQHICSLCHSTVRVHPQSVQYKYCPYCGADMRGATQYDYMCST